MSHVSIKNFTRQRVPRFAYDDIVASRLPGWDISLVYVGETRALKLNRSLRGKTYVPNVLSYSVGKKSGEIIICPSIAAKQAPSYHLTASQYLLMLFIHGILHLEGRAHGATMEQWEQKLLKQFLPAQAGAARNARIYRGTTHSNRNRHRNAPNKIGRR